MVYYRSGDLYFTTGGRIVLDKGYGEYFTKGDKVLFTRDELHTGVSAEKFLERVKQVKDEKTGDSNQNTTEEN